MGDGQEQDQYEERLKELFNSFDASGCGSLSAEELSELCQSLHLDDATPALLHALLQNQDQLTSRVDFDQFKNALILVLSSTVEPPPEETQPSPEPESPEIQPKFVKGSKRYGRRSTPEYLEPVPDSSDASSRNSASEKDLEDNCDSAVPRKRERWNGYDEGTEEYEAEGQMHLWNPDEPSTPRGSVAPLSPHLQERLREACEELSISWDGCAGRAGHAELLALCEHLGLEINGDVLLSLTADGAMNVEDFVSRVVNQNKPPTPSASTPYRQLKRLHSTQPFDEGGRRIATPSALTGSIGMRLFSTLDDGSGFTPAEYILDAWIEEGVENSAEILQALNFDLDGKLSLGDLTTALENELLVTKNGVHLAALASFKAEIRYLLERVDREIREKEKIRSDLEKAERLKTQFATEVDEHHSAMEHKNSLNLRKLEQEHKEKLAAVRSELMKEMDQIQQQAGLQREELETEIKKIREDESFLREHLSISVKESRRLEMELLDSNEKLVEAQSQISKLQTNLDNIMKDKFGDLDPGSADFLLQEERIKQLRSGYEAQCRELQDRIDELQSELQEFHSLGRAHQSCQKPLSEELESKSPGMESDPGIGSEEVQPFSMSLEAEMMLEQLKEQHLQEMEDLRNQLESKISEFEKMVEKQRSTHEDQKAALSLQYQQEFQALQEEMASVQTHAEELQSQLDQAEQEQRRLERRQAEEREELENLQEEEVASLRQQLLEAHHSTADLEEQLKALEAQHAETDEDLHSEMEKLRETHIAEVRSLKDEHAQLLEARLAEERKEFQQERVRLERSLSEDWEKEKKALQQNHELKLEELKLRFDEERDEVVKSLTEQWQKERAQLDEQNSESLQVLLEEEMLRLVRDQEEKESRLKEQWEQERARLQEQHQEALLDRLQEERLQFEQREKKLREEWEEERLQLEEDYEGMIQDRLNEEREKLETEREEEEKRAERLIAEEKELLEERHREAVRELRAKHAEERDALSATLDKLRDDIAQERREVEMSFNQRIREVENRFSGDQESVAERFQADVLKLEQHYQSELRALSDGHKAQQTRWEEQLQKALQSLDRQRKATEDGLERERERLNLEWAEERRELETFHREEMEALTLENKQLQNEVEQSAGQAQTKEIELSRQLNDLHHRLQSSLETKNDLLVQSEDKTLQMELLLNQTVEDFKQERAELQDSITELEAKYSEILSLSERQIAERIELLTERDDLRMKIEELEMLLKQAAGDFEQERNELQDNLTVLQEMLKGAQEIDVEELKAERDVLKMRVEELEMQPKGDLNSSNEMKSNTKDSVSMSGEPDLTRKQDEDERNRAVDEDAENEDECVHDEAEQESSEPQGNLSLLEKMLQEIDGEDPGRAYLHHETCESTPSDNRNPDPPEKHPSFRDESEAFGLETQLDPFSPLQAFADPGNKVILETIKPRDAAAVDCGSSFQEDEPCHEVLVEPLSLEGAGDPGERSLEDPEVDCLPDNSHDSRKTLASISECEHLTTEIKRGRAHDCVDSDGEERSLLKLQALFTSATEENALLHEKVCLLQQKSEILEHLLAHNSEKIKTGQQVLEENYSLKVKMLLLMELVREMETKALKMTALQIRFEDCMCENAKLKDQNAELEKRVWILEGRMNVFRDSQDERVSLVDEVQRMREENAQLSELFAKLGRRDGTVSENPAFPGPNGELAVTAPAAAHLENCCLEFEKHNSKLRRAITDLQDKSQTLNQTTQAHRSEASRLAEENVVLRQRIAALKVEDLKEVQEELTQTLENLNKEKFESQKAAETFRKQISELRLQNQQLRDENRMQLENSARNLSDVESLRRQLNELTDDGERRGLFPAEERNKLAACVSALEAELTKALEDTAQLEERNIQLSKQLSESREKLADESQECVNRQSARLKSDLRVVQQEKDSLKHEVTVLQKQLQNSNDKNHVLEMALHSSGLQNQSKRLYRDEMSRLMEQEQLLLRQENDRLQAEVRSIKDELAQSREKARQLDATIMSLKQHKQQSPSSLLKTLEQENIALKQELEAQRELNKSCEAGQRQPDLETLQQENEALKAQMSRMSSHLFEAFQSHFGGLLPPSPHRVPRGQHRGDDPDNLQDDRERKMKMMEERMKEIELSLHNVKLLLREKAAQLKDQLHKNGKSDVLIKDLYVENSQLLKALEITEQRQKIAEKKNYLLEEKISSLNKIIRDLNPAALPPLPYHYKCS
ncbi:ninein isoform X3 [Salarias fasciatus]|uniref:ninein isoform X3 n=1 Tax=Salarias fasciatus TaxID=181472 RepID=UPI0011767CD6|nr:ninein isoform X3 [Salarias fasciatus]